MTPGFWTLTYEARIAATVTVKTATATTTFTVPGYGSNHGQIAKDGNWQEAYEPAFQEFLANFKAEIAKVICADSPTQMSRIKLRTTQRTAGAWIAGDSFT